MLQEPGIQIAGGALTPTDAVRVERAPPGRYVVAQARLDIGGSQCWTLIGKARLCDLVGHLLISARVRSLRPRSADEGAIMASTSIVICTNRRYRSCTAPRTLLVLDLASTKVAASTMNANLEQLVERAGVLPAAARELLLLASAVYIADKVTPRDDAPTAGPGRLPLTRRHPTQRSGRPRPPILEALQFLTGDHWDLRWRQEVTTIHRVRPRMRSRYDAVCLFSGGLDSFAGAIDLLEDPARPRVLLIGHYDSMHTPGPQRRLANALGVVYVGRPACACCRSGCARPLSQAQAVLLTGRREPSTRSRSLPFIAPRHPAAAAIGPHVPLDVPENGFIALERAADLRPARGAAAPARPILTSWIACGSRFWQPGSHEPDPHPLCQPHQGRDARHQP